MGFGGSASAMNASIKANARLRRKERLFTAGKNVKDLKSYTPVARSKQENRKIRASNKEEVETNGRVNRIFLFVLGIPLLAFVGYIGFVAIKWLLT